MLIGQTTGAVKTQVQTGTVKKQDGDLSRDKVETGSSGCGFVDQMSKLKEMAGSMGDYIVTTKIQECGQGVYGPRYDVSIEFPHIKNDNGFNDLMQEKMELKAGWFIKGLHSEYLDSPGSPVHKGEHSNLTLNYQFHNTLPNGIVSTRLGGNSYVAGRPYPNNLVETVNYDLKTGKEIHLPELFNKNTNYVEELTKDTYRCLKREHGTECADAFFQYLNPPSIENFKQFNISSRGLHIVLASSEDNSIPHVLGQAEVFIPYKDLAGLINPHGPVGEKVMPEPCTETEGSINDNFAQYPSAVVENPGTGEVRPLGEHVLSEKLKKINNPATPIDESISLWKSYKKDGEAYLINPVSFGRDFSDFSYVKTNDSNLQVVGFPKPESLSGSMIEWTNYIQEKNPDGTISLTPLQPEQMEEGSFNLEHYTDGHIFPDGGLELKFTSQASSILITEGTNMFVKVDGEWVKNPAGKI
jgi:hypothetical protein